MFALSAYTDSEIIYSNRILTPIITEIKSRFPLKTPANSDSGEFANFPRKA